MIRVFILLSLIICPSLRAAPTVISDHFDGKKYFNPGLQGEPGIWEFFKWKFTADTVKWEDSVSNKIYAAPVLTAEDKATVTFINHSTFLVQLHNLTILTDPIFAQRASPVKFWGAQRVRAPGIELEMLPPIDVVIISHNHYDHTDLESLKRIDGKFHPLFLVPMGDEKLLKEAGIQNVRQMDWWEVQIVKETKIIFTPSQHWSARGLFDRYKSLWGSYFIENQQLKVYFAGDTGYGPHFQQINAKLGSPDVALIPIGAYEPRWFMKTHHLNPEEAVLAHIDLGAKSSIAMHFGTFQLTDEGREQPIQELEMARSKHDIDPDFFSVLDQGETKRF